MSVYPQIPPILLREASNEWNLVGNQITPGQTASGVMPSIRTDGGGLWVAAIEQSLLGISGLTKRFDDHRAYRAIRGLANGGASQIVVPRVDVIQPWPIVGGVEVKSYGDIPFDDGTLFDDGTGWSQPVIVSETVAGAALRATSLRLNMIYSSDLRGGEDFSINNPTAGWRLHEISTAVLGDDGYWTVNFLPPLREAIDSGVDIEFDLPRCLMRMQTMAAMNYKLSAPYLASPSLSFIEAAF